MLIVQIDGESHDYEGGLSKDVGSIPALSPDLFTSRITCGPRDYAKSASVLPVKVNALVMLNEKVN